MSVGDIYRGFPQYALFAEKVDQQPALTAKAEGDEPHHRIQRCTHRRNCWSTAWGGFTIS